jgi:hypothetical protein
MDAPETSADNHTTITGGAREMEIMSKPTAAELRGLLRKYNALLVHFSAFQPMDHPDVQFPDDLLYAIKNASVQNLRCSVVLPGDVCNHDPGLRSNAIGSVGLIVDFSHDNALRSIKASDGGTYDAPDGKNQTFAEDMVITLDKCERTILERPKETYNEWVIETYGVLGVFVFEPILVRGMQSQTIETEWGGPQTVTAQDVRPTTVRHIQSIFQLPIYGMGLSGPFEYGSDGNSPVPHTAIYP